MIRTVRAKFTVYEIVRMDRTIYRQDAEGKSLPQKVEGRTIKLSPVYSDDPNDENRKFWEATPSGNIELAVINPEGYRIFELGKTYYVDFVEAPEK